MTITAGALEIPVRTTTFPSMRTVLISLGILLALLGLAWPWIERLNLGCLPGDVRIERPGFGFYFPFGSSLLVSVVLSLLLSLIFWLWRR